ncbi:MAG: T9SS C-terminal target domain-containing protein, partial [Ignavibacteriales bacterium]
NPATKIKYTVPNAENHNNGLLYVTLKVYDVLGNEIAVLVNEHQYTGHYEIEFIPRNLASGMYFYKLQAGALTKTMKMIYSK